MAIKEFYNKFFKPGKITTDSRKIKTGDIFVALSGENFNGNHFAEQALQKGAKIAVVDEPVKTNSSSIIKVEDCLVFLQELANYHRSQIKAQVIALTGSNGKTTTKELIYAVLSQHYRVQATKGNLNNHIGVPLTLLDLAENCEYAIVEMGANHPGEIKRLCEIAEPDMGLITNIGKAHLEGFGGFDGVKKTKYELYASLKERGGKIYFNAADDLLVELKGSYENAVPYNSTESQCWAEITASQPVLEICLRHESENSVRIRSNLFGDYNAVNIIAAACIGFDLGLELPTIQQGIENYVPSNNRSQIINLQDTILIMDCYNANPSSMQLAIKEFSMMKKNKKMLILGGMKELGTYSSEEHLNLGKLINQYKFDRILLTGDEFSGNNIAGAEYYTNTSALISAVAQMNLSGFGILIKGSRANKLEEVGAYIQLKNS